MRLRRMPAVLLPLGPLSCSPLVAAEEPTELEPIIVTATRLETPIDRLPASVSVVEGEEVERQQVKDIFEVLRDVPGFTIVQSGSRGGAASLFVRGGESDFNQVLIDGVKVNESGGAFDFSDLTTDGLDRIEIVRGPHSALYGSDAVTSVVQVFTRRGEGPLSARLGFAGGEFETYEGGGRDLGRHRALRLLDRCWSHRYRRHPRYQQPLREHERRLALRPEPARDAGPQDHGALQRLALRDAERDRGRSLPAARPEPALGTGEAGRRAACGLEPLALVAPRAPARVLP